MSSDDAAMYLGVTTRTLYRIIDRGELPAYQFGRVIRLRRGEVDEFIDSRRLRPDDLKHLDPHADGGTTRD